jgi:hypothetical protein
MGTMQAIIGLEVWMLRFSLHGGLRLSRHTVVKNNCRTFLRQEDPPEQFMITQGDQISFQKVQFMLLFSSLSLSEGRLLSLA